MCQTKAWARTTEIEDEASAFENEMFNQVINLWSKHNGNMFKKVVLDSSGAPDILLHVVTHLFQDIEPRSFHPM